VYGDAAGVHVGVRRPLPAEASAEPFAFGDARRGNLQVGGRWKPGFYTFVVRTTHRASGVQATVSLAWANRRRC
jgi:hypothetical protein